MKKFKKIFAIVLAMAMVLGMSVTVFADTPAATPGNITISGLNAEEAVTVRAFQVLEFDSAAGAWKLTDWAAIALQGKTEALSTLTTQENSDGSAIAECLTILAAASGKEEAAMAIAAENETSVTLSTSELGSYLVICESNNWSYTNMLVNNYGGPNGDVLIEGKGTAKGTHKNIIDDKKVDEGNEYVAVGDIITYTVTGTFPHFEGYSEPSFKITDTMTDNLVAQTSGENGAWGAEDITIKINGTAVTFGDAYTVTESNSDNGFVIEFVQNWLIANADTYKGKNIEITYKAQVTGYSADGYTNTVKSTIKTDNSGEKDGDEVETTSYTAALELKKIDSSNAEALLEGAEFILQASKDGETKYVQFTAADGVTDMELVESETDASRFKTNSDGVISVNGLDPDYTYTLVEKVAPNGYSLSKVTPSIQFTPGTDNKGVYTAELSNGDNEWKLTTNDSEKPQVTLKDTKLSALPSTGGIGTTVFTIGGCAIIIVAAGLFFASRRKKSA